MSLAKRRTELQNKLERIVYTQYVICGVYQNERPYCGSYYYLTDFSADEYRKLVSSQLAEVNAELAKWGH